MLFCNLVASSPCRNAGPGVVSCVITGALDALLTHRVPSRGPGRFLLGLSFPTCKPGALLLRLVPRYFYGSNYLRVDVAWVVLAPKILTRGEGEGTY